MNFLQATGIIRGRGQLTIPDKIRKVAPWADTSSVVSISIDNPDEIVIRPHRKNDVNWDKLWEMIDKSRSIRGNRIDVSEFIKNDRNSH